MSRLALPLLLALVACDRTPPTTEPADTAPDTGGDTGTTDTGDDTGGGTDTGSDTDSADPGEAIGAGTVATPMSLRDGSAGVATGDLVTLRGLIVVGVNEDGFFAQHPTATANAGVWVFDFGDSQDSAQTPQTIALGDEIDVAGRYVEFSRESGAVAPFDTVLEVDIRSSVVSNNPGTGYAVLSRGNALPPEQVVSVATLANAATAEPLEAMRVRLEDTGPLVIQNDVTGGDPWFFEHDVSADGGTTTARLDNRPRSISLAFSTVGIGDTLDAVRAVVFFDRGLYKLAVQNDSDFVGYTDDPGDTGDTSDTGDTGDTSDTGDTGDTSDTGDTGATPAPLLQISEVLPDPSGGFSPCDEGNAEFIEIFNPGAAPVSLVDAVLTDDSNQVTLTAPVSVPAGGYTVVARERAAYVACWGESAALHPDGYGFGLSNAGETITLSLDGTVQDTRTYSASNVLDGVSFQRDADGTSLCFSRSFEASGLVGTPGAANTDCDLVPLASSVAVDSLYDGSRTLGDRVRVQGLVVTAVNGLEGFFAQAPTGTSDAAVYVILAEQVAAPAVGSTVDVTGWYRTLSPGSTLYAQPRLDASFFGDLVTTGAGAALPSPVALGADAFSITAGDYVAMRVEVSNILGDLTVDAVSGGQVTLSDGFAFFAVDGGLYDWPDDVGTLSVGDTVTSVTGVVVYENDTWLLAPTGAADIAGYTDL